MWGKVRTFFSLPRFPDDDEKNRKAATLAALIRGVAVALTFNLIIAGYINDWDLTPFLGPLFLFPLMLGLWVTLRSGRVTITSFIMVAGMFLVGASYSLYDGGIRSPAFGALGVMALLAGLLFGIRGGVIVGAFAILVGIVLVLGEQFGYIDPRLLEPNPWPYFVSEIAFLIVSISILNLAIRNIRLGYRQADSARSERARALEELDRSEARYRAIVEDQTELINRVALDGVVTYVNQAYARLFSLEPAAIIGMKQDEFLSEHGLENIQNIHASLTPGNPMATNENLMVMPDGTERWLQWKDQLIIDDDGQPFEYQGVGRDITERRRMEEDLRISEERYRGVAENALVGISITSEDDRFLYVNPAFSTMLGYTQTELLMMGTDDLITHGMEEALEEKHSRRRQGIAETYELLMRHKNGDTRLLQISASPLLAEQEGFEGTIAVLIDITDQRRNRLELTRQLEELGVLQAVSTQSLGLLNEDDLIEQITRIIGETIYSDHFGVLLLDDSGEALVVHPSYHGLPERFYKGKLPLVGSISGKVVLSGQSIRIDDIREAEDYLGSTEGIQSEICVPLLVGGLIAGVINAESRELGAFDDADERLLQTVAGLLGTAMERARLFKASQGLTQELDALYQTALEIGQVHELPDLFARYFEQISTFIPVSDLLFIYPDDDGEFEAGMAINDLRGTRSVDGIQINDEQVDLLQSLFEEQKGVLITDEPAGKSIFALLRSVGAAPGSIMLVPLLRLNDVIGVLVLGSEAGTPFQANNLRFMEALAPQVAIAIENTRLFQQESDQRALAEALRDTAMLVTSTLDFDDAMEQILKHVDRVVPHDAANIMIVEEGTAITRILAHRGYDQFGVSKDMLEGIRLPLHDTLIMGKMLQEVQPRIISDTESSDEWYPVEGMEWIRSYLSAPIIIEGTVVGFLNLDSKTPNFFKHAQADRLGAFANQAAIAVENATLYRELERHAEFLEQAVEGATNELRQEKERVEVILNNSPDVVLLLTTAGTIELVNLSFSRLFEYSADQVLGQNFAILVEPSAKPECVNNLVAVVEQGATTRSQVKAIGGEGEPIEIELALAPIEQDGVVYGVVCTIRDISAMKEVERLKDAFVSNVSHELRTPITSLKLNHSLLRMNPEKSAIYLERLGREVDRLNYLIEDLLRLSRLDQGKTVLALKEIDLHELLDQIVEDRMPLASERGLTLEFMKAEMCPKILADPGLVGQAASVFLTNAMTYTPEGGKVSVRCMLSEVSGEYYVGFEISDTGPGIRPEELPQIFSRFYRGGAAQASGAPGTGLGLAIAQEIVNKHQGRLEVESDGIPGKGATFRVLLPVEREPPPVEPVMRRTRPS